MYFPRSSTKAWSKKSDLENCTTFNKRDKNLKLSNKIIPRCSIENICRVLLCDDEYLIRKTLDRFLDTLSRENSKIKFEIDHAENGYECLSQIYKSHNEGIYYDVLIIDETMPFIKGSQMIFLLKSMIMDNAMKNIIIVSFTSYDSPDKIDYIYSQGADYVMTKPMTYDDFKIFFTDEILTNQSNHNSSDEDDEE
jgi:CheY-like chemotaxis protein